MMNALQKRVALFATQFVPYSQTFIYDEVTHHIRYDADVFTVNRINEDIFPYDNVKTFDHTIAGSIEKKLAQSILLSPYRNFQVDNGHYAILHAHFGTGCVYALPHAQRTGLPLICTYHGYDVPLLMTPRRFHPAHWRYWLLSKWMLRRVDRFLAASDELHNLLVQLGAPPEKVFTWRLGIKIPNQSALIAKKSGKKLIQCGRFVEKKGFVDTLNAFNIVRNHYLNAGKTFDLSLELIGNGPLLESCKKFVRSHNLQNNVTFTGALPQDTFFKRLNESDILLCPSVVAKNGDRESGILVAKEAAARSIPVIGTLHGGIPEIIDDNQTGFLVPEHSPQKIAEKIILLTENSQLRKQLGENARNKMIQEYRLQDRIRELENHYDETIAQTLHKR